MGNCQPNCGCKFEVDSSCVRYTSINLGTTSINIGDTIETTIIKIDEAINNLQQTFESGQTPSIEGPTNKVIKFGPPNTPLLPSQTFDDGISIGINAVTDPAFKMSLETSPNQSGLKVSSLNNGKDAIVAKNESIGVIINKGIVSLVSGSSTSNIGIESAATGVSNINIGISATALGGTTNYSAQLKDGSETVQGGKFLKDTGSGKANWNYIYLSDIQDYQAPVPFVLQPATSFVLGGVKIGSGINVANDGTISVPTPTAYSLPTASSTVLGGIKVGNGLSIDVQGVLSTALVDQNPQKFITTHYTLTSLDHGYSIIVQNGANPLNITIPNNLQAGMQVGFIQDGTGDVTFTLSGGVVINCAVTGANKIKGQYEQAFLEQGASQTVYYLLGNVKV